MAEATEEKPIVEPYKHKNGDKIPLEATVISVDLGDPDPWVHLHVLGVKFSVRGSALPLTKEEQEKAIAAKEAKYKAAAEAKAAEEKAAAAEAKKPSAKKDE